MMEGTKVKVVRSIYEDEGVVGKTGEIERATACRYNGERLYIVRIDGATRTGLWSSEIEEVHGD